MHKGLGVFIKVLRPHKGKKRCIRQHWSDQGGTGEETVVGKTSLQSSHHGPLATIPIVCSMRESRNIKRVWGHGG